MKALVILILSFVLSNGIVGQEKYLDTFPLKDGKVTYSAVIQTDGIAKDELYKRAKIWLANNTEIIKFDDKDLIVGGGVFLLKLSFPLKSTKIYVRQIISIEFKDGKYKYDISDFRINYFDVSNGNAHQLDFPLEKPKRLALSKRKLKKIDPQVKDLISSLDKAMKTPIEDNW